MARRSCSKRLGLILFKWTDHLQNVVLIGIWNVYTLDNWWVPSQKFQIFWQHWSNLKFNFDIQNSKYYIQNLSTCMIWTLKILGANVVSKFALRSRWCLRKICICKWMSECFLSIYRIFNSLMLCKYISCFLEPDESEIFFVRPP